MSLKEFDWKKFLLMKGERIAPGLCILTTVVLVVMSLFMPGHGFRVASGVKNAEELNKLIRVVENGLKTNTPREGSDELPPDVTTINLKSELIKDEGRKKYQLAELFVSPHAEEI